MIIEKKLRFLYGLRPIFSTLQVGTGTGSRTMPNLNTISIIRLLKILPGCKIIQNFDLAKILIVPSSVSDPDPNGFRGSSVSGTRGLKKGQNNHNIILLFSDFYTILSTC